MNTIAKGEFLERLISGRYLPLEIKTSDGSLCYQLYELEKSVDKDIVSTIKTMAIKELHYYKMEGLPLPDFNFLDLDGNVYNKETTTNKIIVMNCWYVQCSPCVAEMPSLNQVVKQFEKDKNILFLALALDPANDVKTFLNKHIFKYAIVPDKKDYLSNKLNIIAYPTQLVINRQGIIVKVLESNKISELKDVVIREIKKL
jgi:peroxiredoxin